MYQRAKDFCKDYLIEDSIHDFSVSIKKEDLEYERSKEIETSFSDSYLELTSIYRKICERMAEYETFMMHGSVIAKGNSAYMFTAPSGTGKTTHCRLWLENIPDTYMVNGDKPLIYMQGNRPWVCGTPWCGKERLQTNCMIPLEAVIILERGEENEIAEVSPAEYFGTLLKQVNFPVGESASVKVMKLVETFMNNMRFYKLRCNIEPEAAFVSYNAVSRQ